MQRFISARSLAAAGLVLGALGAASVAHARSDVYFSIGVQPARVYVEPAPVYAHPRPVYVQPQPVYVQPQPYYSQPQPVYAQPQYGQYQYQDQHRYYHGGRQQRRYERLYGPNGDLDRDGIPNQYDRDRDGDGVRNRFDRDPNNGWRY